MRNKFKTFKTRVGKIKALRVKYQGVACLIFRNATDYYHAFVATEKQIFKKYYDKMKSGTAEKDCAKRWNELDNKLATFSNTWLIE